MSREVRAALEGMLRNNGWQHASHAGRAVRSCCAYCGTQITGRHRGAFPHRADCPVVKAQAAIDAIPEQRSATPLPETQPGVYSLRHLREAWLDGHEAGGGEYVPDAERENDWSEYALRAALPEVSVGTLTEMEARKLIMDYRHAERRWQTCVSEDDQEADAARNRAYDALVAALTRPAPASVGTAWSEEEKQRLGLVRARARCQTVIMAVDDRSWLLARLERGDLPHPDIHVAVSPEAVDEVLAEVVATATRECGDIGEDGRGLRCLLAADHRGAHTNGEPGCWWTGREPGAPGVEPYMDAKQVGASVDECHAILDAAGVPAGALAERVEELRERHRMMREQSDLWEGFLDQAMAELVRLGVRDPEEGNPSLVDGIRLLAQRAPAPVAQGGAASDFCFPPGPPDESPRDRLGRAVREAWIRWACNEARVGRPIKPHWFISYGGLEEHEKEADRLIGEAAQALAPLLAQRAPEGERLEGYMTQYGVRSLRSGASASVSGYRCLDTQPVIIIVPPEGRSEGGKDGDMGHAPVAADHVRGSDDSGMGDGQAAVRPAEPVAPAGAGEESYDCYLSGRGMSDLRAGQEFTVWPKSQRLRTAHPVRVTVLAPAAMEAREG